MKSINLSEIKQQLVENIYELLVSKGYNPEEGIDIEKCLHESDLPLISYLVNSYCLDLEDEWAFPFQIKYLVYEGKDYFAAYDYHPDRLDSGRIVDNALFFIESLEQLFETIEDIENNYDSTEK